MIGTHFAPYPEHPPASAAFRNKGKTMVIKAIGVTSEEVVFPPRKS